MAKHSIHFATGPNTVDNLRACVARACVARAVLEGLNLHHHGKLSRSKIIDAAIAYGAQASAAALLPVTPALPETTGSADADRLIRARGSMTRADCARAAGLKDESSVRNVESPTRGMKLAGKLLAWVESIEAQHAAT